MSNSEEDLSTKQVLEYSQRFSQNPQLQKYFISTPATTSFVARDSEKSPRTIPKIVVTKSNAESLVKESQEVKESSSSCSTKQKHVSIIEPGELNPNIHEKATKIPKTPVLHRSNSLPNNLDQIDPICSASSRSSGEDVKILIFGSSSSSEDPLSKPKTASSSSSDNPLPKQLPSSSSSCSCEDQQIISFGLTLSQLKQKIGLPIAFSTPTFPLCCDDSVKHTEKENTDGVTEKMDDDRDKKKRPAQLTESKKDVPLRRDKKNVELTMSTPVQISCFSDNRNEIAIQTEDAVDSKNEMEDSSCDSFEYISSNVVSTQSSKNVGVSEHMKPSISSSGKETSTDSSKLRDSSSDKDLDKLFDLLEQLLTVKKSKTIKKREYIKRIMKKVLSSSDSERQDAPSIREAASTEKPKTTSRKFAKVDSTSSSTKTEETSRKTNDVLKKHHPHEDYLLNFAENERHYQIAWIENEISHLSKLKMFLETEENGGTKTSKQSRSHTTKYRITSQDESTPQPRDYVIQTNSDISLPDRINYCIDGKKYTVTQPNATHKNSASSSITADIEVEAKPARTNIKVNTICSRCHQTTCTCKPETSKSRLPRNEDVVPDAVERSSDPSSSDGLNSLEKAFKKCDCGTQSSTDTCPFVLKLKKHFSRENRVEIPPKPTSDHSTQVEHLSSASEMSKAVETKVKSLSKQVQHLKKLLQMDENVKSDTSDDPLKDFVTPLTSLEKKSCKACVKYVQTNTVEHVDGANQTDSVNVKETDDNTDKMTTRDNKSVQVQDLVKLKDNLVQTKTETAELHDIMVQTDTYPNTPLKSEELKHSKKPEYQRDIMVQTEVYSEPVSPTPDKKTNHKEKLDQRDILVQTVSDNQKKAERGEQRDSMVQTETADKKKSHNDQRDMLVQTVSDNHKNDKRGEQHNNLAQTETYSSAGSGGVQKNTVEKKHDYKLRCDREVVPESDTRALERIQNGNNKKEQFVERNGVEQKGMKLTDDATKEMVRSDDTTTYSQHGSTTLSIPTSILDDPPPVSLCACCGKTLTKEEIHDTNANEGMVLCCCRQYTLAYCNNPLLRCACRNSPNQNKFYCICNKKTKQKYKTYCKRCRKKLVETVKKQRQSTAYTLILEEKGTKENDQPKKPKQYDQIKVQIPKTDSKRYKDRRNSYERYRTDTNKTPKDTEDPNTHQNTLREYLIENRPEFIYSAEYRRQLLLNSRILRERNKNALKLNFLEQPHVLNQGKVKLYSEHEMKEITKRHYEKLPEVKQKHLNLWKNRLRQADRAICERFAKKIQKSVVLKKRTDFPIDRNVINL